jgi:hypothetical protein
MAALKITRIATAPNNMILFVVAMAKRMAIRAKLNVKE